MAFLKKFARDWGLLVYIVFMLTLFLASGGGLKTTLYVVTSLSFVAFLFWDQYLGENQEVISYWGRTAILAFTFFMTLSYAYSMTPNVGLNELIGLFFGVLIFSASYGYFKSSKKVHLFYRWILIIALLAFFYGAFVYVFYPFNRFAGPFVDLSSFNGFFPNAWVDFVIMVFPFALFMLFESTYVSKKLDRVLGGVATVGLLTGLILSFSRGGWLSFALTLVVISLAYLLIQRWKFEPKNFVKWTGTFASMAAISVLLACGLNWARSANGYENLSFYKKATLQSNEKVSSVSERQQFYEGSLKLLKERPLLGYGLYSFRYTYPRHQQELLAFSDHPHSIAHKIAAEGGLISLMLFFIFCAIVLAILRHGLVRHFRKQWIFVLISTGSLFGVMFHNVIDYNFNFLSIQLLAWVVLGQLFALVLPKVKVRVVKRRWQWWMTIGMISLGLLVGIHEAYYGYFLKKARGLDKSVEIADIDQRIEYYEEALNLWQPRDVYVALLRDYIRRERFDEALVLVEREAPRHPYYAEMWYFWGELLRQKGDFEGADKKYRYAIKTDPLNEIRYYFGFYLNLLAQDDQQTILEWRGRISTLLEAYAHKLRRNEHYTVLTANPKAAHGLYEIIGESEKAAEIKDLFELEMDKLRKPKEYAGK